MRALIFIRHFFSKWLFKFALPSDQFSKFSRQLQIKKKIRRKRNIKVVVVKAIHPFYYRVSHNPCPICSYRSKWLIGQVFGELINTLVKRAHVKNFTLGLGGNGDRLTHILIAAATAAVTPRKGRAKGWKERNLSHLHLAPNFPTYCWRHTLNQKIGFFLVNFTESCKSQCT